MKKILIALVLVVFSLGYVMLPSEEIESSEPPENPVKQVNTAETVKTETPVSEPVPEKKAELDLQIVDRPIKWTENRENLIREYAKMHYGMNDMVYIDPQAVVVHWTAANNCDSVYNYFYGETMPDDGGGTLNVASHFLVDRDGTIYRLTPENALNRHAIGYNWCAIGIENVGGEDGREDLTEEQLQTNIALIKYLKHKYSGIKYVWGHYQQDKAEASGLFIEKVPDYYAVKIDPGEKFMAGLRIGLADSGLKFYQ